MKNLAVFMSGYLLSGFILICSQFPQKKNKQKEIKTEYKLELINKNNIKVYDVSNDTTYICKTKDLIKTIDKENE